MLSVKRGLLEHRVFHLLSPPRAFRSRDFARDPSLLNAPAAALCLLAPLLRVVGCFPIGRSPFVSAGRRLRVFGCVVVALVTA